IVSVYQQCKQEQKLMLGFNRRFAPHIVRIKSLLSAIKHLPKCFIITVNAGEIPPNHWVQNPQVGGGRIIGEVCHFIDLMRFLADAPITGFRIQTIGQVPGVEVTSDKVTIGLNFSDGSFGSIHYLSNGGRHFPKERVEVFCNNAVLQLDNYRKLKGYNWPGFKKMNLWQQDKGHNACVNAFLDAVTRSSESPIPFEEIIEVSRITIEAAREAQVK
ncbi:Gfo/Idh/MocA family protein, partial [Pseudomonadota bacterium]